MTSMSTMSSRTRVAQRCLDARNQTGLSQAKFAVRIGFDPATISRWERGVVPPDARGRRTLASITGKSESHFSPDEGEEGTLMGELLRARRLALAIRALEIMDAEDAAAEALA